MNLLIRTYLVRIHFPPSEIVAQTETTTSPKFRLPRVSESMNRHCCVANTHALEHKTFNAHAQIRKTDFNPGLDKKKIMKCGKAGLK
jgi:hypothetical protein